MTKTRPKDSPDPITRAAEVGKKRKSFFSFGDDGVTATVGANGRLLRISRHFPGERTGFCVDNPDMPEPWFVGRRLHTLLNRAENPTKAGGIGPSITGTSTETIVNDRWPTFDGELEDGRKFKLQYVANGGTIYQKFEFLNYNTIQRNDVLADRYSLPEILVRLDLLIRDLDFVDANNSFNEAYPDDPAYESRHCGNCLVREHIREHVDGNKKCVLSVHVLDEHESFQFVESGASDGVAHFMIQRKSATTWNDSYDNSNSASLGVILAYTLEYVSEDRISFISLPPWELVSKTMSQLLQPHEKHSLTNNSYPILDPILGRNLEYILSVCSIPISDISNQELPSFALTCGDVDGHRVAGAASFHAFQVLLVALDHFRHHHKRLEPCDCRRSPSGTIKRLYVCMMMDRLYRVCGGHVKWLLQNALQTGDRFCPNYWVNGDEIADWQHNSILPQKTLVDTPFQIIKTCAFIDLVGMDNFPWPVPKLHDAIEAWVQDLDGINKLGLDAFPRYDDEPTQSFYFTDHALIWEALKSAETLNLAPKVEGRRSTSYSSSSHFKRNMLSRFTTENLESKKRMLAVTRSPAQTRFLLRSRDTALFRAMELGLFDKPEEGDGSWLHTIDLWKSTVDCQKDHQDNDDLNWTDPRRFALSLIMARINKSINLRPPKEMFEHAMSVLLRASSANGLFPGRLNERHEPTLYDYEDKRDSYWENVFEIPYILWKHCPDPGKPCESDNKPGKQSSPKTEIGLVLAELQSLSRSSTEITTLLRETQGRTTGSRNAKAAPAYSMKYVQSFNNVVDEQKIVELDDEWLYNEPAFFVRNGTIVQGPDTVGQMEGSTRGKNGAPGSAGQESSPLIGFMANVSKSRPWQKSTSDNRASFRSFSSGEHVKSLMGKERNMEEAKKRFWTFLSARPSGNEACLNTVFAEEEQEQEMQSFFDRHNTCVRFFTEETSAVLNSWTTEMHLSFYRLDTGTRNRTRKAQKTRAAEAASLPGMGKGGRKKPLLKVAMGFRFEGDFFNNYWTCRFLEADRQEMERRKITYLNPSSHLLPRPELELEGEMSSFLENGRGNIVGKTVWQQRRVLELMLFGRLLQRMNLGANEVLAEAWFSLRGRHQTLGNDSWRNSTISEEQEYDVFLSTTDEFAAGISRKKVEQVQRVLQAMIGNLDENITQIALWQDRETSRLAGRPRWTFHDENRFRDIIQKLVVSNDHEILKLTRVRLKISKLEESLVKKLETIRNDLEERRGGETQLFTYVTVVFLPLGFATGIFSMSGAPATHTLNNMIYTALGAFGAIAVMGLVVKMVIAANVARVPSSASQDWSEWKAELKQKSIWNWRWIRRRRNRPGPGPV